MTFNEPVYADVKDLEALKVVVQTLAVQLLLKQEKPVDEAVNLHSEIENGFNSVGPYMKNKGASVDQILSVMGIWAEAKEISEEILRRVRETNDN